MKRIALSDLRTTGARMTYAIPKARTNYGIFNIRFQGAKL